MSKFSILLIIPFLAILMSNSGCSNCEDEQIGTVELLASTKPYLTYTNGQVLNLIDESGTKKSLKVELVKQNSKLCTNFVCTTFSDPFQSPPCQFFQGENLSAELSDEAKTIIIGLSINIEIYQNETENFYDVFVGSLSEQNVILQGHHVLEPHFTNPKFDKSTLSFVNIMTPKSSVSLNGKTFTDVLSISEGSNAMYFKKGIGLLGYVANGKTWVVI